MTRRSFGIPQSPHEAAAGKCTVWWPGGRPGQLWRPKERLGDMDEPQGRLPWPWCAWIIFAISGLLWAALVFAVVRL